MLNAGPAGPARGGAGSGQKQTAQEPDRNKDERFRKFTHSEEAALRPHVDKVFEETYKNSLFNASLIDYGLT